MSAEQKSPAAPTADPAPTYAYDAATGWPVDRDRPPEERYRRRRLDRLHTPQRLSKVAAAMRLYRQRRKNGEEVYKLVLPSADVEAALEEAGRLSGMVEHDRATVRAALEQWLRQLLLDHRY